MPISTPKACLKATPHRSRCDAWRTYAALSSAHEACWPNPAVGAADGARGVGTAARVANTELPAVIRDVLDRWR
jgi:hypothetical protein